MRQRFAPRSTSPILSRCRRVIHCGVVPTCFITPHIGGSSPQFAPRAIKTAADELRRYHRWRATAQCGAGRALDCRFAAARRQSRRPSAASATRPGVEQRRCPQILVQIFADVHRVHHDPEPPVRGVLARLPPARHETVACERRIQIWQRRMQTLRELRRAQNCRPPRRSARVSRLDSASGSTRTSPSSRTPRHQCHHP